MAKQSDKIIYPNLEWLLREMLISRNDLGKLLDLPRSSVYKRMTGEYKWQYHEMCVIFDEIKRRAKSKGIKLRNLTIDFLFEKEESPDGNK